MRGILVSTDKTYRVLDVSVGQLGSLIGGFIVCENLYFAHLEERIPKPVHLVRRNSEIVSNYIPANSYATKLVNSEHNLSSFVVGNVFILEKQDNDFVGLNDDNMEFMINDLITNGYKEVIL